MHGSIALSQSLLEQDLVDELRLVIAPALHIKGRKLFDAAGAPVDLRLVASEDAGWGVLRQIYDRP